MSGAQVVARWCLLGALWSVLSGPMAFAQARDTRLWYQAYEEGVRAVQKQDWQAAISSLQAALKLRPQQGRRVAFYGDRVDVYIPDYYLGVAYMNLRRFSEADAAFARVQQQGLVTAADSQFRTLQAQAATARFEARMASAEAALSAGDIDRASDEAAELARLGGDRDRVERLVTRITDAVGLPKNPPIQQTFTEVPNLIGLDMAAAGRVLDGAQLRLGAVSERASSVAAGSIIEQALKPRSRVPLGSRIDLSVSAAAPAPPVAKKDEPAPATAATVVPPPPGRPRGRPPQPAPVLPGTTERVAIRAFFEGEYQSAAQMLGTITTGNSPSPRARFYLACSLAALVVTGEREADSTTEARRQLAMAGSLDQYAVDRRLVSPRILSILGIRP